MWKEPMVDDEDSDDDDRQTHECLDSGTEEVIMDNAASKTSSTSESGCLQINNNTTMFNKKSTN